MRFTISSTALYARLTAASKVMAAKNSMPILDCFLLDIRNGQVNITASDGEKYFITQVPLIDSDNNAILCVQAKTVLDSIKEIPEQPLTIDYNPETNTVTGIHQTGKFNLMATDASTYPQLQPVGDNATTISLPSNTLLTGINRCLFATANDEVRLVMTGIYLDMHESDITFAGTDGRKLVRYKDSNVQPGVETGFILPKKVSAILKTVLAKDGDVTLSFDSDRALIKTADFSLFFRMIEGRYPNYNGVIPQNNAFVATVDRQSLLSALKRVSVFCSQASGLMKLTLDNNQLKLSAQDIDYGTSAEENLMCEYSNSPVSIGFSCRYMIEIANIIESESLSICIGDPSRPGIVLPTEQPEGEDTLTLLMPMMLNE